MTERNTGKSQGISKEMSEVLTWISGHDATCKERYDAILKGLRDCKEAISEIRAEHKTSLANLEAEMKESDAAIKTRVANTESQINNINIKIAYAMGAGFAGSLLGGWLFQLLSGGLVK